MSMQSSPSNPQSPFTPMLPSPPSQPGQQKPSPQGQPRVPASLNTPVPQHSQHPQVPQVPPCLKIPPAPQGLFAPQNPSKGEKVPIPQKPTRRMQPSLASYGRHTDYTGDFYLESLDDSRNLFASFLISPPTFKDACKDAGITERIRNVSEIKAVGAMNNPEMKKFGLTLDEAQAIACYTVEVYDNEERQKGVIPPYTILNRCLACSRTKENITKNKKIPFPPAERPQKAS